MSAGFAGIGGGMFKGPILLELGMPVPVQVATTSFMIVFTATSTTMQYLINGFLDPSVAAWYAGVGAIGAAIGQCDGREGWAGTGDE